MAAGTEQRGREGTERSRQPGEKAQGHPGSRAREARCGEALGHTVLISCQHPHPNYHLLGSYEMPTLCQAFTWFNPKPHNNWQEKHHLHLCRSSCCPAGPGPLYTRASPGSWALGSGAPGQRAALGTRDISPDLEFRQGGREELVSEKNPGQSL